MNIQPFKKVAGSIMNDKIKKTANKISEDSKSWMTQYERGAPEEIRRRKERARGIKELIRAAIGIFINPPLKKDGSIYIFEGLRNKKYMSFFNPQSVFVVGSHLEKEYAESQGYKFCWSFPIVSAIHLKIFRDWNFPIFRQIRIWEKKLSRCERVVFFLYEDTQPLGVFFAHLGKTLKPKVVSICIQHGYFCIPKLEIRCDGRLSDINFVWDAKQAEVIGSDKSSTFVIGLPYDANAAPIKTPIIILVGTGMAYEGNDDYEASLTTFIKIYNELHESLGLTVYYRPHPNEWLHQPLIKRLRNTFPLLDDLDKIQRLNNSKSIFIGTVSSLLYEAGVAGHLVAHINLYEKATPVFKYDFDFEPDNVDSLIEWVSSILQKNDFDAMEGKSEKPDSLERFGLALSLTNLVDIRDVKRR